MLCEKEPVGCVPDPVIILLLSSLGDYLVPSGSVPGLDGGARQTPDLSSDPVRPAIVSASMAPNSEALRFQMLPGTSSIV
jgi:hypothetical protein